MADKFDPPPRFGEQVDENGNVVFTPDEARRLRSWLERLTQFLADNYAGSADTSQDVDHTH